MQVKKENNIVTFIPENQAEFEILREIKEKGIRRTSLSQSWDSKLQELNVFIPENDGWD